MPHTAAAVEGTKEVQVHVVSALQPSKSSAAAGTPLKGILKNGATPSPINPPKPKRPAETTYSIADNYKFVKSAWEVLEKPANPP